MPRTPPFELRRSPIQGRGAFATRRIRAGARIIEYLGERITPDEADARYDDDDMERHHTFLFIVDDDVIVDGAVGGNDASYINHSCEPNCEAVIEDGRIFIEAIHDIAPGEELVYDYQLEREGPYRVEWKELYACRCGAPSCRGTILKPRPPRKRPRRPAAKHGTKKRSLAGRAPAGRQVSKSRRGSGPRKAEAKRARGTR